MISLFIEARRGCDDGGGVRVERLFEDGGQSGAGILHVTVDAARLQGLLADIASGEVKAALYFLTGAGFDVLGQEFSEDNLFGEILGTDDEVRGARRCACRQEK